MASPKGINRARRGSVKDLKLDLNNANKGSKRGREAIRLSLEKLGAGRSILVDKHGRTIAGNHVLQEYSELGHDDVIMVPTDGKKLMVVQRVDLDLETDEDAREMAIADNRTTELNLAWNAVSLRGGDRPEFLFTQAEWRKATIPGPNDTEAPGDRRDIAGELREKWETVHGDLWVIPSRDGQRQHRLLCGDATSKEDVDRLLAGEEPTLMVTDPPYGVAYDPHWRARVGRDNNVKKMGEVTNDDRADWTDAWRHFPGPVLYIYHAGMQTTTVANSIAAAGFQIRAQIIWVKDRMAINRGDYHWQHEPVWYAVRKGAKGMRTDDRSQTTVWKISERSYSTVWEIAARDDDGHGHSTQKPVECMQRPIRNHTGDVYDPFIGSGTTIIASERENRICYGMEIAPEYVAVTLERLSEMGLKPERAA